MKGGISSKIWLLSQINNDYVTPKSHLMCNIPICVGCYNIINSGNLMVIPLPNGSGMILKHISQAALPQHFQFEDCDRHINSTKIRIRKDFRSKMKYYDSIKITTPILGRF